MPDKNKVRTRFAPSPTGHLHIGGLRTAIYSYALAKHTGGDFILRIEDTDKKREVEGSKEEIKELLQLFGLELDGEHTQSERVKSGIYQKAAEKLVSDGHAFYCECASKDVKNEGYSKELKDPCRNKELNNGAIKLKTPSDRIVKFDDFVLNKEISWNTNDIADATLLKSDGFPTYHLAVVVDDNDMQISHVLRGHAWLPSTPIHLLVYEYLGFNKPSIGHLTDILDPEGGKLSKRKGSISVRGLIDEGFLPSAIANFVMLLGWAPKGDRELFTLNEFVEAFDIKGFQKSNPVFNRDKLKWFNGEYLRKLSIEELYVKFSLRNKEFEKLDKDVKYKITELVQTRVKTLNEFDSLARFFFKRPKLTRNQKNGLNKKHLEVAFEALSAVKEWNLRNIESFLLESIDRKKFHTGNFFMTLRVAITGSRFTPPINESMVILGKDEVAGRIRSALR